MPTPALQPFLDSTGKVVHHLNSIVVGLSAVELGIATKPPGMDITWAPTDPVTSSRQARAFALRATLIYLAEEMNCYVDTIINYPGLNRPTDWTSKKKAERVEVVHRLLGLETDYLVAGALLVSHWRNRNIHSNSNARLTEQQRHLLLSASAELATNFKNLDPDRLLKDFERDSPTLKDVSSLVALTIRCFRRVDEAIPSPKSAEEVNKWIDALGLQEKLNRVRRVAAAKGKEAVGVETFIRTNCPALLNSYLYYCADGA